MYIICCLFRSVEEIPCDKAVLKADMQNDIWNLQGYCFSENVENL